MMCTWTNSKQPEASTNKGVQVCGLIEIKENHFNKLHIFLTNRVVLSIAYITCQPTRFNLVSGGNNIILTAPAPIFLTLVCNYWYWFLLAQR